MLFQARTPGHDATDAPVIALHGSAANGGQWRAYAQALPQGVRLHTPDLLGYGAGPAWPAAAAAALSLDDEVQALAPLFARLPQPVHLVGHSYGGAVALQIALRWPQRVRSLTLYEPVRFALLRQHAPAEWGEIRAVAEEVGRLVIAGIREPAAARFVDYWGGPGSYAALPHLARQRILPRMGKVVGDFAALFTDRVPESDIAALRVPLRLLVGTRSPAPAQRVAERLATICGDAVLQRLPGAGHLAPSSEPARVLPWLPFTGADRWPLAA